MVFIACYCAVLACIAPGVAGFQRFIGQPALSPRLVLRPDVAARDDSAEGVRAALSKAVRWHSRPRPSTSLSPLGSALNPSEHAWQRGSHTAPWTLRRSVMTGNGGGRSSQRSPTSRPWDGEVRMWRAMAGIALSLTALFRRHIDRHLAALWEHLMTGSSVVARAFRTDSYEWCLAVVAFVVWMHGYYYADLVVDGAARRGRVHPWRKYRLQDRYEADKARRAQQLAATNALGRSGAFDMRQGGGGAEATSDEQHAQPPVVPTKQSAWNRQAWFFELWVYVLPLLTWDLLAPRRHRRLAPFGAPTTLRIIGDVTLGLLFYDFLFFCGHCLMHKVPWIFRSIHAKHHGVQEVRAGDTVRLSFVEEVMEVGFSIVALNLLGIHPLARTLYNCVITFLLTELHSGFDFPWSPQNVVPFGLATGSRRHHYHHRNGRHYYQKFFFTFDRLFGLYQKDDGTLDGDSVKPDPYLPPAWQAA